MKLFVECVVVVVVVVAGCGGDGGGEFSYGDVDDSSVCSSIAWDGDRCFNGSDFYFFFICCFVPLLLIFLLFFFLVVISFSSFLFALLLRLVVPLTGVALSGWTVVAARGCSSDGISGGGRWFHPPWRRRGGEDFVMVTRWDGVFLKLLELSYCWRRW